MYEFSHEFSIIILLTLVAHVGEVCGEAAGHHLAPLPDAPRPTIHEQLEVWAACTDAGPDIACARSLIVTQLANDLWTWFFEIDCIAHQYQMLSLMTLQPDELAKLLCLPTNYYSCLAIVMHLVRDNARSIWTFCVERFGGLRTLQLFPNIPPIPISGRWGQASKCECWLEPWEESELQLVFVHVIANRSYHKQAVAASQDCFAGVYISMGIQL